jgi:hypothetical protein
LILNCPRERQEAIFGAKLKTEDERIIFMCETQEQEKSKEEIDFYFFAPKGEDEKIMKFISRI